MRNSNRLNPWKNGDWIIDSIQTFTDKQSYARLVRYGEKGIGLCRYLEVEGKCLNSNLGFNEGRCIEINDSLFEEHKSRITLPFLESTKFNDELEENVRKKVSTFNEERRGFEPSGLKELFSRGGLTNILIYVVNVGQGDTIIVLFEGDKKMRFAVLIDAHFVASRYKQFKTLLSQLKIEDKLECLVISHPHFDHISGADKVVTDFNIPMVLVKDGTNHSLSTFQNFLEHHNSKVFWIRNLLSFTIPNLGVVKIFPSVPLKGTRSVNENGLIVWCQTEDNVALMGGDISGNHLLHSLCQFSCPLLKEKSLNCFYKVSHHCSITAEPRTLRKCFNFSKAATSVGLNNKYKHPHNSTKGDIDRLTRGQHRLTHTSKKSIVFDLRNFKFI